MVDHALGRKKSNFPAIESIPSGATLDFVSDGVNYKIGDDDFNAALGVTGTIVQDGAVAGTPILDKAGTVNSIRNLEDGPGIITSVSPENGAKIAHNFALDTTGAELSDDFTIAQPIFRSIVAGSGINVSGTGDTIQIALSGAPASTKTVIVNQLSDLPTAVSNVITLETDTQYQFTNDVSIGIDRLVVQNNTVITGADSAVILLTYTGSGDMITAVNSNWRIDRIRVSCANGRVFNSTDTGACIFQMIDMTISTCDRIGLITGHAAAQINNVAFTAVATDGIATAGAIGTLIGTTLLATINGGALFNLGTAVISGFNFDASIVTLAGGTFGVDGLVSSGNIATGGIGTIHNNRFSGAGTPLNNVSTNDALWQFALNDDIADTRPDGLLSMQANATNTVITVATTAVLVAGTWVVEDTSQMTGTTAGRLTYDGGKDAQVPITASVTIAPVSGGAQTMAAYIAINGTVDPNSKRVASVASGTSASITIPWQKNLSTTDFVEVFVANDSGTTDVLVSSAILRVN